MNSNAQIPLMRAFFISSFNYKDQLEAKGPEKLCIEGGKRGSPELCLELKALGKYFDLFFFFSSVKCMEPLCLQLLSLRSEHHQHQLSSTMMGLEKV